MKFLDVVNDKDEVIAYAGIIDIYLKNIPHRVSHVFLFNEKGEMALQKRSNSREFCPAYWNSFVATHVEEKESYKNAALREFKDEFKTNVLLEEFQKDVFLTKKNHKKFIKSFKAKSNDFFEFNKEKIEKIEFFSFKKIQEMIDNKEKFHPELLFLLEKHFDIILNMENVLNN